MSTAVQPAVVDPPARRGTAAIVGLGVALLGAAAAVSAFYTREDGEIDWSVYAIGLGVTAALVLVTLAGSLGPDLAAKRALTGFPGAVGAIAAGVMVSVGLEESWEDWAVGGVILGVSVVAYLLGRAGAPTVSAIAGLAVLYGKAVDELIDPSEDNTLIVGGAVVVVFAVAVTAIGWVLPHRALIGTVVGAGAVVGLVGLLGVATIAQSFAAAFSVEGMGEPTGGPGDLENDVYVFLAYAAALVLLWTLAAWATASSGFRVLAVVLAASIVPLSLFVLVTEHPTWWGAGFAVAGGLALLLALMAARRGRAQVPPPTSSEPPPPFFDNAPPPATPAEGTPPTPASPASPASKTDDTVIAPASAPPPPDPQDRRPT